MEIRLEESVKRRANDQFRSIDFLLREVTDVMMSDSIVKVVNDKNDDNTGGFLKKYEEIVANLKCIRGELDNVAGIIGK